LAAKSPTASGEVSDHQRRGRRGRANLNENVLIYSAFSSYGVKEVKDDTFVAVFSAKNKFSSG
jgi:hypothetical protein